MKYNHHIDVELITSAEAVYNSMTKLCELLGTDIDSLEHAKRLSVAIGNARTEMQLQEEMDRQDLVEVKSPTSND